MFRQATKLAPNEWAKPWLGGELPSYCKALCLNSEGEFKYEHTNPKYSKPKNESDRLFLVRATAPRGGQAGATSNPRLHMAIADDTPNLQLELEIEPELNNAVLHELLITNNQITDDILIKQCRNALFNSGLTTALSSYDVNHNGLFLKRLSNELRSSLGFGCSNISFIEPLQPQPQKADDTVTTMHNGNAKQDKTADANPSLKRGMALLRNPLGVKRATSNVNPINKQQLCSKLRQLQKDINSYQQQYQRFISLDEYKMLKQLCVRIDDSTKFHLELVKPSSEHLEQVHQQLLACETLLNDTGGSGQLTQQLYQTLDALCRSIESR